MDFVIHLHSGLRWFLLLAILIVLLLTFAKRSTQVPLNTAEKKMTLIALILMHLQVVLGLILYFGNKRYEGFSQMDVSLSRFLAIEHMLGMIIAAVLITVGYKKTKGAIEGKIHNKVFLWFMAAFLVIIISIPWPFRGNGFDYFGYF